MPICRLGRQIAEVAAALNANGVGFAPIGFELQALDDLMAAVEILCPVWPPRDAFLAGGNLPL